MSAEPPEALIGVLNDPSVGSRAKERALAGLADAARAEPERVLSLLAAVDATFETLLNERHDGVQKFGTALGRMHETVLLVLMRATGYRFSTAQLLDFLRGDVPLALTIMFSNFVWPIESWNAFIAGDLVADKEEITVSPR